MCRLAFLMLDRGLRTAGYCPISNEPQDCDRRCTYNITGVRPMTEGQVERRVAGSVNEC